MELLYLAFIHVKRCEDEHQNFETNLITTRYGDHLSAHKQLDREDERKIKVVESSKISAIKALAWMKDPKFSKEKWKLACNTLRLKESTLK